MKRNLNSKVIATGLFNVANQKPIVTTIGEKKIFLPIEVDNILLNSMGLVIDPAKAAMWRGPMLSKAIKQLKNSTQWGNLDYLFIDCLLYTSPSPRD